MTEYMHLIGVEQVQTAANTIRDELERAEQHASELQSRLDRVKAETIGKVKELVCDQCKTKL